MPVKRSTSLLLARREFVLGLLALPAVAQSAAPIAGSPDSGHLLLEAVFFRQATPKSGKPTAPVANATANATLTPLLAGLRRAGYPLLGQLAIHLPVAAGATGVIKLEESLPGAGLVGRLSLARSQLLTIQLNAHCEDCRTTDDIDEHRRVKFGERHYFDSPVIGAILSVNPLTGES